MSGPLDALRTARGRVSISDATLRRLNLLQIGVVAVIILSPIAWMVLSSLKPSAEVTAYPPTLWFIGPGRGHQDLRLRSWAPRCRS